MSKLLFSLVVLLSLVSFQNVANESYNNVSYIEMESKLKYESVYNKCMKEQKDFYNKLRSTGRLESSDKDITAQWRSYCKSEAELKAYPKTTNGIPGIRLHGEIDPKISSTKGGHASDANQAKACWVKNPPPSCN